MQRIRVQLELPAAAGGLEVDAADGGSGSRTIAGTILPYGEAADLGLDFPVRFLAGSLQPMRDRTPLTLGHDMNLPIGVLADNAIEERDGAAFGSFTIDQTPHGDSALAQAASGSRAGLSISAELVDYAENAQEGVIDVSAADLVTVGLVTVPAYAGADVATVAASQSTERSNTVEAPATTPSGGDGAATTPETQPAIASREVPVVLASRAEARIERGDGARLVHAMIRAAGGDRDARAFVEAALSELATTDVPGLVPVAYTTDILDGITVARVLADRVAVRRPLPASGMKITKPHWTTLPNGGWVAENADIPSNKPEVGTADVNILEWAYGVSMSYAVATRSSPDAIEAIFRAAVQDYYLDVEAKLADIITTAAQATAAGAGIGGGVAEFFGANRTNGQPAILLCSPDIFGDLVNAEGFLMYASGSVNGAGLTGTIAGLEVVVSPDLDPGTEIITTRGVVELRETDPVRLTANAIGALQVELGVTAFASFDLEKPDAVWQLTPAPGAPAGGSEARRTSVKTAHKGSK